MRTAPWRSSRRIPLSVLVVLSGLLAGAPAWSQSQDTALSARIREAMQPFVDSKDLSGVVTMVGAPKES